MLSDRDYDLISGYLDDALIDSERAEVESRLGRDAEFATELTAIRRTITLVKTLPELVAPRDFRLTREQASQIDRENMRLNPPKRTVIPFRRVFVSVASAAASLIMIVAGFLTLAGGRIATPLNNSAGGVAMVDVTNTAILDLTEMISPDSQETLTALNPAGTSPAPIAPTSEDDDSALRSMGGGGFEIPDETSPGMGGGAADIFMAPATTATAMKTGTSEDTEEAADMMPMMALEAATPTLFATQAALTQDVPPAPTYPEATPAEAESSTMMFESVPAATSVADSNTGAGEDPDGTSFGYAVPTESVEMAMQVEPVVDNATANTAPEDDPLADADDSAHTAPFDSSLAEGDGNTANTLIETAQQTPMVGVLFIGAGVILACVAFLSRPKNK